MHYYSTKNQQLRKTFAEAALEGQPADKGLYFPSSIPRLPESFFEQLPVLDKLEIAVRVLHPYTQTDLTETELAGILKPVVDIRFPLVKLSEDVHCLELFHGPTLAFKDVGASFMSGCFHHFAGQSDRATVVLVATSGDTGGAVANAFARYADLPVVILYPSGKVSKVQEQQLTATKGNVTALEVDGNFDDCQRMVKDAFADPALQRRLQLTSANSINVSRWIPQQLYYFFALQQWKQPTPPVFSVPSGNLGNLSAGLLAFRSGLPVRALLASCNSNDAMPRLLATKRYQSRPTIATLSNAMDVGDPSNVSRMLELFSDRPERLYELVKGFSVTDQETRMAIAELYEKFGYISDPHGAVAYAGLKKYQEGNAAAGIFLATAHPVKFPEVVESIVNQTIEVPASLSELMRRPKRAVPLPADSQALLEFLVRKF